jgi:hypothetical protein
MNNNKVEFFLEIESYLEEKGPSRFIKTFRMTI